MYFHYKKPGNCSLSAGKGIIGNFMFKNDICIIISRDCLTIMLKICGVDDIFAKLKAIDIWYNGKKSF